MSVSAFGSDEDESRSFVDSSNCNCPADCTETVYLPEMSQAKLRSDSSVFDKVKKNYLYQQLVEGVANATK